MTRTKKIMIIVAIPACVFLLACGNKVKQTDSMANDGLPAAEELQTDTAESSVQNESPKEVESPSSQKVSSSSSSITNRSATYDNMRGFDPASEDDMEDNGMSRYIENNDEEGWD